MVTSKLDVREAAARLPQDEVDATLELDALDPMHASDAEPSWKNDVRLTFQVRLITPERNLRKNLKGNN